MNISVYTSGSHIYLNCEYIQGFAFKDFASREKSAHFAYVNDCFECLSPDIIR